MNAKKSLVCVCCGCHLSSNLRRPVKDKCLRLFVATRLFPSDLPNDGHICNKCRSMYNKWKSLPEFYHIFTMIDDDYGTMNEIIVDVSGGDTSDDCCMDEENDSDHMVKEISNDNESMDDDSNNDQTADAASNDNQSDDEASSDDKMQDEEMSLDGDSDAVSYARYPSSFLFSLD